MSNTDLLKQLGVDENLRPISSIEKNQPSDKYYKANFSPVFSPIPDFKPKQFTYASLTEKSVSVIGRYNEDGVFYQITVVIPRYHGSGTYAFEEGDGARVRANILADGYMIEGRNGSIKLIRDNKERSIEATFNFQILHNGRDYKVYDGRILLLATGDL